MGDKSAIAKADSVPLAEKLHLYKEDKSSNNNNTVQFTDSILDRVINEKSVDSQGNSVNYKEWWVYFYSKQ